MTHPLAYPTAVTVTAVAGCAVLLPFSGADQQVALLIVLLGVIATGAYRLAFGLRHPVLDPGTHPRRVRQEHRLTSRSWIETPADVGRQPQWLPVYFDPNLLIAANPATLRLYPSGRRRGREPVGRLIDNPARPDPEGMLRAARAAKWRRRVLLDSQSCVAAPFIGLFWVYIGDGGLPAFAGATWVGALVALWSSTIRGSDPS